jgi:hypothetical protein
MEKFGDDNTLRISYNANSILITLNENKTKAILKGRGGLKYEFIAEFYNKDWISINEPIKPIREQAIASFLLSTQQRVPEFLFALASSVVVGSLDFKILSQDQEFMNATKKGKKTNSIISIKTSSEL